MRYCVGGVADGGDHRHGAGGDGAGDGLVVEAVEVFPAAAATGDDDYIRVAGMGGEPPDAGGDLGGAARTLHRSRIDEQVDGGVTAAADLDDVAQGRALQAGDDADAAREGGQRAVAVEEAFPAEALLEALDGGEQRALADLFHGLGDELHLAAALVDAELAAQADGVAVFGLEAQ